MSAAVSPLAKSSGGALGQEAPQGTTIGIRVHYCVPACPLGHASITKLSSAPFTASHEASLSMVQFPLRVVLSDAVLLVRFVPTSSSSSSYPSGPIADASAGRDVRIQLTT